MKTTFNLSTSPHDITRFNSRAELLSLAEGFDGVELMVLEKDERGIIPKDLVVGLHMNCYPYWLDFWNGDHAALTREFGDASVWEAYYGGKSRDALLGRIRHDLENARRYEAEYVVFHVSDASATEAFTETYRHTDEEVVEAVCLLLGEALGPQDGSPTLLLENLWQPGLRFTRPEITARLLEGIPYKNKGLMLDTGHLLHTNASLRTQEEGLAYIHTLLDAHGPLCRWIRGVHLHQSLTGEYSQRMRQSPPVMGDTYQERFRQMFEHAFAVDRHLPFTCPGVGELISRISPQYLTFEFITDGVRQHRQALARQREALSFPPGP